MASKRMEMMERLGCDCLGRNRAGNWVAKWTYFYHNGASEKTREKEVLAAFPDAVIIDSGDHWHAFVGGARTGGPQDSYLWVEFKA